MTGEIVNLRRVRKTKARSDQADQAAENRIRFGRTRAERQNADAAATKASRHLDGHLLTDDKTQPLPRDDG